MQLTRTPKFDETLQDLRALHSDTATFDAALAQTLDDLATNPAGGEFADVSETTAQRASRIAVVPPCYVVHTFVTPDRLLLDRVVEASQLDAYRSGLPTAILERDNLMATASFTPQQLLVLETQLLKTRQLPEDQRPAPIATTQSLTLTLDHIARRKASATP